MDYKRHARTSRFARITVAAAVAFNASALMDAHFNKNNGNIELGVIPMAQAQVPRQQEDVKAKYQIWLVGTLDTDRTNAAHPLNPSQKVYDARSGSDMTRSSFYLYDMRRILTVQNIAKLDAGERKVYDAVLAKYGGDRAVALQKVTEYFMDSLLNLYEKVNTKADVGQYAGGLKTILDFTLKDMNQNPALYRQWLRNSSLLDELNDRIAGSAEPKAEVGRKAAVTLPADNLMIPDVNPLFFTFKGNANLPYTMMSGTPSDQMKHACGGEVNANAMLYAYLNAQSYLANFKPGQGNPAEVGNAFAYALEHYYAPNAGSDKRKSVQSAIDLARSGTWEGIKAAIAALPQDFTSAVGNLNTFQMYLLPTGISVIHVETKLKINFVNLEDYLNRAKSAPKWFMPLYSSLIYEFDKILVQARTLGASPGAGGQTVTVGHGDVHTAGANIGFFVGTERTPLVLQAEVNFKIPDIKVEKGIPIIGAGGTNLGDKPYSFQSTDPYVGKYELKLINLKFVDEKTGPRWENVKIQLINGSVQNPLGSVTLSYTLPGTGPDSVAIYVSPQLGTFASDTLGPGDFAQRARAGLLVGGDVTAQWVHRLGERTALVTQGGVGYFIFPLRNPDKMETKEQGLSPTVRVGISYNDFYAFVGGGAMIQIARAPGAEVQTTATPVAMAGVQYAFDVTKSTPRPVVPAGQQQMVASPLPASVQAQYIAAVAQIGSSNRVLTASTATKLYGAIQSWYTMNIDKIAGTPAAKDFNSAANKRGMQMLQSGDINGITLLRQLPSFQSIEARR